MSTIVGTGKTDQTNDDAAIGSGSSVTICDSQKGGKVGSVAKLVKEKRMPTIIFIHADWCGHCQHTRPEWDKFIEKLAVTPRAKGCAAMAVEESSLPEFQQVMHPEIQGFPTILFTKSGDDNFKEFSGMQRTADNLMRFFLENIGSGASVANISKGIVTKNSSTAHKKASAPKKPISAKAKSLPPTVILESSSSGPLHKMPKKVSGKAKLQRRKIGDIVTQSGGFIDGLASVAVPTSLILAKLGYERFGNKMYGRRSYLPAPTQVFTSAAKFVNNTSRQTFKSAKKQLSRVSPAKFAKSTRKVGDFMGRKLRSIVRK